MGPKILFAFVFCLIVLSVDQISALLFSKIAELGTKNNITSTKVELRAFDYNVAAIADSPSSDDIPECEKFIVLKFDDTAAKIRNKPKGYCRDCCKTVPGDVRLLLFSKMRPKKPFVLPQVRKKKALYRSLNNETKVIIYIHGFMEIPERGSGNNMKEAFLNRKEDYAVILVDWSNLASFPFYFAAASNVRYIAKVLTKFLESYSDDGVIDIRKVHFIGFSLGAQVAGFVGKFLRKDLRIPRITALDPAYPAFNNVDDRHKLTIHDADFVDVIHTDGGNFGFIAPIGHVDFYPNDGTYYQPGCGYKFLQKKNRMYDVFSCSHNRAHKLYVESVYSPYNFPAIRCHVPKRYGSTTCNNSDIAFMGFAAESSASGSYYLKTNMDSPYGRSSFDINSKEDW